ncbi:MAG TPA: hypothetical protein VFM18_21245, partial [Methanosarcina sp.]|nr:hypothetical protein [Methanosarcina sp.]
IKHLSGSHVATAMEEGVKYPVYNPLTRKTTSTLPAKQIMEKIHAMPDAEKSKFLAMKHGTKSQEYKNLSSAIQKKKFARGVALAASAYGLYNHYKNKASQQDQYYY